VDTALVFLARRMRGIHQGLYLELDSRVIPGAGLQSYTWSLTPELRLLTKFIAYLASGLSINV